MHGKGIKNQVIKSNFKKIGNEDVFLQNANGRCLSKSIVSKRNNPNFDASSMDGFAINTNDYKRLECYIKVKRFSNLKYPLIVKS